jgi:hypothetical protein
MRFNRKLGLSLALVSGAVASAAHGQSLTTLFAGGNGGSAGGIVYFDVNITNAIIINSLDLNTATAGSLGATVYTTPGTYVGNQTNMGAWTAVSTGSGTGAGVGNPTMMPMNTPFQLNPGTYGIAIVGAAPGFSSFAHTYTNGTGANQFYSNADLSITLGAAQNAPFTGTPFTPRVWNGTIHYTAVNPSAVGACCFPNGTCEFITLASCQTGGGSFRGENVTCATANCPQPGACCLNDGTCIFVLQTACGTAGGTWAGAGVTCATANCPQPSACCFFDGTCSMLIPVECAAQGGTSLSGTCATASCPGYEIVENLPGVFTDIATTGTFVASGDDVSAPFFSSVTNALVTDPNLFASTNGVISSVSFTAFGNTALPAAAAGRAFFPFWDDLFVDPAQNGAVLHQAVNEGGINVHIVQWNNVRTFSGGAGSATGTFQVKFFESGPVLAQYIYQNVDFAGTLHSNGLSATVGFQASGTVGNNLQYSFNQPVILSGMVLSIVPTGGGACYANCDGSTVEPILNVEDFTCFINEFASAQTLPHAQQVTAYANCDGSTTAPALNVEDFTCFINQYAQGCP